MPGAPSPSPNRRRPSRARSAIAAGSSSAAPTPSRSAAPGTTIRPADARSASAAAGRADARQRWLSATETALGDSDDASSVGVKLTAVYAAGSALAGNPSDTAGRSAFLQSIDDAAGAVRATATGLAKVSAGIGAEAGITLNSVNAALDQLTQVNVELTRAAPGTSASAALQDQRDQILDGISANIDIDVSLDPRGVATVTLAGSAAVALTGPAAQRLALATADDGRLSVTAESATGSTPVAAPGGALGGLVESAAAVSDRRATLDGIAANFAQSLNAWSAQGTTASGASGGALLAIAGGSATTLALTTTSPAAVAAATPGGAANGNLLALSTVRAADASETRWAALVNDHARLTASATAESDQHRVDPRCIARVPRCRIGHRSGYRGHRPAALPAGIQRRRQGDPGRARNAPVHPRHPLKARPMISATQFRYQAEVNRQSGLASEIAKLQTDISTGVRIQTASDDPAAAARVATLRRQQADTAAWSANVKSATATANAVDGTMTSITTAVTRAQELLIQARSATTSASDRATIAGQLRGIATDLRSYAGRTDVSGQPLFPARALAVPIGEGSAIAATPSAADVFTIATTGGGSIDLATLVDNAATTLATGSGDVSGALTNVAGAVTQVADASAAQGVRAARITAAGSALTDDATALVGERSDLESTRCHQDGRRSAGQDHDVAGGSGTIGQAKQVQPVRHVGLGIFPNCTAGILRIRAIRELTRP